MRVGTVSDECATRADVVKALEALLPRLWRFARTLTRESHNAEDLVQATCVRVLEKWMQFRPGTRFDRWAMTILANIHRAGRRGDREMASLDCEDGPIALQASGAPADERAHLNSVLAAINALPEGQRSAVLLVYAEGFTYREAGEVLNVPTGTIMSRLHAARRSLAHLA